MAILTNSNNLIGSHVWYAIGSGMDSANEPVGTSYDKCKVLAVHETDSGILYLWLRSADTYGVPFTAALSDVSQVDPYDTVADARPDNLVSID